MLVGIYQNTTPNSPYNNPVLVMGSCVITTVSNTTPATLTLTIKTDFYSVIGTNPIASASITSDNSSNVYVSITGYNDIYVCQVTNTYSITQLFSTSINSSSFSNILYALIDETEYVFVNYINHTKNCLTMAQINISDLTFNNYNFSNSYFIVDGSNPPIFESITTMIDPAYNLFLITCQYNSGSQDYNNLLLYTNLNSNNNYLISNTNFVNYNSTPSLNPSGNYGLNCSILTGSAISGTSMSDSITTLNTNSYNDVQLSPYLQQITIDFSQSGASISSSSVTCLTYPSVATPTLMIDLNDAITMNYDDTSVSSSDSQKGMKSFIINSSKNVFPEMASNSKVSCYMEATEQQLSEGIYFPSPNIMDATIYVAEDPTQFHASTWLLYIIRKQMLLAELEKPNGDRFFKFRFNLYNTDRITGFKNKLKKIRFAFKVKNN